MEGKFPPHEAFAIGGTNSVRGYEEGAVGSGRSYVVGCGEVSCRLVNFFLLPTLLSFCHCQMDSTWKYDRHNCMVIYHRMPYWQQGCT